MLLVLATVGLAACVAASVAVWTHRQKANDKVQTISTRVESSLERLSGLTKEAKRALQKARAELDRVNRESARLEGNADQRRPAAIAVRALVRQDISPKLNDLGPRLATLSDAAVVIASLLESLEDLPELQRRGVSADKVKQLAELAGQLPGPLRKLESLVNDDGQPPTRGEVAAAAGEVDRLLERSETTVDGWQSDLDAANSEVQRVKTESWTWLTYFAIGVTVLSVWMGLGQLSLWVHAWKWCWHAGARAA
jgi:hypothetical protein